MAVTLFKEVSLNVSRLIDEIETGEIGLPDIQRPFVWNATKVRNLFDSMYAGFPVGYLLFWSNAGVSGARQIGSGAKQSPPRLLIVDGQQRLTSLYAVIRGVSVLTEDYRTVRLRIAFRPRDGHFAVTDPYHSRFLRCLREVGVWPDADLQDFSDSRDWRFWLMRPKSGPGKQCQTMCRT